MRETERLKALGETAPRLARDPVSQPIINAWLDAMDETDPRFTDRASRRRRWRRCGRCPGCAAPAGPTTRCRGAMEMLDAAGYTSVLGTNCDQTYERYLRVGEQVSVTTQLEDVAGPKQTGVGRGLLRHHPQRLARRRRGGRDDAVPGAQVQAAPDARSEVTTVPTGRRSSGRCATGTPTSSGRAPQQGELRIQKCNACGRAAPPARARCARRATRWTAGTSSRAAAARSSASSCTTPRRCRARSCR